MSIKNKIALMLFVAGAVVLVAYAANDNDKIVQIMKWWEKLLCVIGLLCGYILWWFMGWMLCTLYTGESDWVE
jgi:Na+-driven multidrug efflux pump